MRVILATQPISVPVRNRDGLLSQGQAFFQARAYRPDEDGFVSRSGTQAPRPSVWLRQANPSDFVVVSPPPSHPEWPEVKVPAALLRTLADDDGVVMEWIWRAAR